MSRFKDHANYPKLQLARFSICNFNSYERFYNGKGQEKEERHGGSKGSESCRRWPLDPRL